MPEPPGRDVEPAIDSLLPLVAVDAPERAGKPDPYDTYIDTLKSPESKRAMAGCLDRIAAMVLTAERGTPPPEEEKITGRGRPWWVLRYAHTTRIRAQLIETGWSPKHVNKHLSALRGVLKQCWQLEYMDTDAYMRAKAIENVKGSRLPAGRSIHGDEHDAIDAAVAAEDGARPVRDRAILALLRATGLRRSEVAGLCVENWDPAERQIRVVGKGDKEREVPVYPSAAVKLDRWLNRLNRRRGPMFPAIDRWGNVSKRHINARTIGQVVEQWRRRAGVAPLATHDFRRSLGGDMLDAGADLVQVQKLFGHQSATTTAGYDRRPGRKLRAAVDRLDPQPHHE